MGELSNNVHARTKAINAFFDKKEKALLKSLEPTTQLDKLRIQRRAILLASLDVRNIILLPDEWL